MMFSQMPQTDLLLGVNWQCILSQILAEKGFPRQVTLYLRGFQKNQGLQQCNRGKREISNKEDFWESRGFVLFSEKTTNHMSQGASALYHEPTFGGSYMSYMTLTRFEQQVLLLGTRQCRNFPLLCFVFVLGSHLVVLRDYT